MNRFSWKNNIYFLHGRRLAEEYINSKRNYDRHSKIFEVTHGYDRNERAGSPPNLSSEQIINFIFGFVCGYLSHFGSTYMDPVKGDLIKLLISNLRLGRYSEAMAIFNDGKGLAKGVYEANNQETEKDFLTTFVLGNGNYSYEKIAILALGFLEYMKERKLLTTHEIEKASEHITQVFFS